LLTHFQKHHYLPPSAIIYRQQVASANHINGSTARANTSLAPMGYDRGIMNRRVTGRNTNLGGRTITDQAISATPIPASTGRSELDAVSLAYACWKR
jgi:hypothetical protein